MSDEQLEQWLMHGNQNKMSNLVPTSADRLTEESPGDGETAMKKVAAWLSKQETPVVEMAVLSPRTVTITFAKETVLPEPWVSYHKDPGTPSDHWGITHEHAMNLPYNEGFGTPVAGLTGIGTLVDGSRGLINTARWEVLQIAGTEEWVQDLLLTQIMSQAAEPWSSEHDIWLVGFEEAADKLMNFLIGEHPRHHFKVTDSLQSIKPHDLSGNTATIYVKHAGADTLHNFAALQAPGIGMVVDTIITDEAMFLTERDDGSAILGPFSTNLKIWPNLRRDLIAKMEYAWEATEEIARQRAAELNFDELLRTAADEDSHENELNDTDSNSDAMEAHELSDTSVEVEMPIDEDNSVGNENMSKPQLKLLGGVSAKAGKEVLTGRNAALLAILVLEPAPISPRRVSELLWPGDEPQGHTARTRRSRLKAKVDETFGQIVIATNDGWTVEADALQTDYDSVLDQLSEIDPSDDQAIYEVCNTIARPIEVNETWANEYRSKIIHGLIEAMTDLKNKAVDTENYDAAKALKRTVDWIGGE